MIESSDDDADVEEPQPGTVDHDGLAPSPPPSDDSQKKQSKPRAKRPRMENGVGSSVASTSKGSFKPLGNQTIGFVGLGRMGFPLADSLRKRCKELVVHTRSDSTSKYHQLTKRGTKAEALNVRNASTALDVFNSSDITFICAGTQEDINRIFFEDGGIVESLKQRRPTGRKGVVNLSTVDIAFTAKLDKSLSDLDVHYLEAAMLGSQTQALSGELILLCAGSRGLFDETHTYLQLISRKALFLDDVGNGMRMKLCMQGLFAVQTVAVSEMLLLADKAGLSGSDVADVVEYTDASSALTRYASRQMLEGVFDPEFRLSQMQADVKAACDMADTTGQPVPLLASCLQTFKRAKQQGEEDMDFTAVHRSME